MMKKIIFYLSILFLSIIFFSSCDGLNSFEVTPVKLPLPDEVNLRLGDPFKWRIEKETANIFVQNNTKVLSSSCKGLQLRDIKTGELEWAWEDMESPNCNSLVNPKQYYIKDNLLLFFDRGRYYCLDLITGSTLWKKETLNEDNLDVKFFSMTGVEDLYFQIATIELDDNRKQDAIFMGNINTSDSMEMVLKLDLQQDTADVLVGDKNGGIWDIEAFQKENGDILLSISYGKPFKDTISHHWFFETSFGLWNLTQKHWEYRNVPVWEAQIYEQTNHGKIKIIADRLYIYSEMKLSCYDLKTADLIWAKEEKNQHKIEVKFSEENIFINYPNIRSELLDPLTGEVSWYDTSPYPYFDVAVSNNYLFHLSGSLDIYDVSTGRHLGVLNSPYDGFQDTINDYFQNTNSIKVFEKEKGKVQIIISTEDYMFGLSYGE